MNIGDTKLPTYPRLIRLYMTKWRETQLDRRQKEILTKDITKIRISRKDATNGTYVFPEIEIDKKWVWFRHKDVVLACFVRSLSIGEKTKLQQLEDEWYEWLEDWLDENNLDIKFDKGSKLKKVVVSPLIKKLLITDLDRHIKTLHKSGKGPNLIARLLHVKKRDVVRVLNQVSAGSQPVAIEGHAPGSNQGSLL